MNNKHLILILFSFLLSIEKIDINHTNYEELSKIPLPKEKIIEIIDFINNYGQIEYIYDLIHVNQITSDDIKILKSYIVILDINKNMKTNRSNSSYKVDQWFSSEGNSEGISELWLDRYYTRKNINQMSYDDILALPKFKSNGCCSNNETTGKR